MKTSNRTFIKYNLRSKSTILRNVRCFKFWHRRSITAIPQWNKQNESYTSKLSFIYTSRTTTLYSCETMHSIGAALLQSHSGTNKMNLIPANSRLFTQAELRLCTLVRKCTAIKFTLTESEFLILGSKKPGVLFSVHKPIIFLFTQKSNPNQRNYRFEITLRKFPNLHIVLTSGKNLALPYTLSRNTPPDLLT